MLNNKLMFLTRKKVLRFEFNVTIGKSTSSYAGITSVSRGFISGTCGSISPSEFLAKPIKSLFSVSMTYQGMTNKNFYMFLNAASPNEFTNSKIKLIRKDTNASINLTYNFVQNDEWLGNDETTFFTDSDVGKVIPILIEYTPPQAKALFSGFIKATKGWLHSLCASLFASVEVVNA